MGFLDKLEKALHPISHYLLRPLVKAEIKSEVAKQIEAHPVIQGASEILELEKK